MPIPQIYLRYNQANLSDIVAFKDSTPYTNAGTTGTFEVHTFTIYSNQLKNPSYIANVIVFSFDYYQSAATTDDFYVYFDGVPYFTFPTTPDSAQNYKVCIPIKNPSVDHTIGVWATGNRATSLTNAEFTIVGRMNA